MATDRESRLPLKSCKLFETIYLVHKPSIHTISTLILTSEKSQGITFRNEQLGLRPIWALESFFVFQIKALLFVNVIKPTEKNLIMTHFNEKQIQKDWTLPF